MIAELKGKISSTGSNLNERLEDKLTGDSFGSLRYIPFNKVAKSILLETKVLKDEFLYVVDIINRLNADYWDNNIQFWPKDSLGELDILIEFEDIVIGIEVKLYHRLSSDDNIDNSNCDSEKESNHQLSRESRILKNKISGTNKSALLIFVAPEYICYPICKEAYERNIIKDGVILGYLPWEEILVVFEKTVSTGELNIYEELIIKDIIALLKRKGLERFKNFDFDYPYIYSELWFMFNGKKDMKIDITFDQGIVMKDGFYEFR